MKKIMYFSVLCFLLMGMWTFLQGYFMGGTIRSPEGIMLGGIEMMLFAFVLFVAFLVVYENKDKEKKHDHA